MLDLRIGFFLGLKQIQRANWWSTILIVVIIIFTFLNLVAVNGILIGIVDGAIKTTRHSAVGDVVLKALDGEERVLHTEEVLRALEQNDSIESFTPHYIGIGTIEANYTTRRNLTEQPDTITVQITGIDQTREDATTDLSSVIGEGAYFDSDESGYIILGKYTIDRYADKFGDAFQSLDDVYPGDTVRVTVDGRSEEFIVKGIIDSKVDMLSLQVFLPEREFRRLFDRADHNAESIILKLKNGDDEYVVRDQLLASGMGAYAKVEAFTDGVPKFLADVEDTFSKLSIFIGAIGIFIASITVFIVIFINALSRRRQIGILKAIGITEGAIKYAYVTQAGIYAIVGSTLGVLITLYVLIPYFLEHPIDFPYSDVSLSVSKLGMIYRYLALLVVTLIAGFVPAWIIVRQNTLNAILGRK